MSKNHIDMSHMTATTVVDIMADVDFTVEAPTDTAGAISAVVLDRCTKQVQLMPGKYNLRLMVVITSED